MPATKPYTFADGTVINGSNFYVCFTTFWAYFNGQIVDAEIKAGANIKGFKFLDASIKGIKLANDCITETKINYESAKVLRTGLSTSNCLVSYGSKDFTIPNGTAVVTGSVLFNTADLGDPNFSTTPRIVCGLVISTNMVIAGNNRFRVVLTATSSTGFDYEIRTSGNVGADLSGKLHWIAKGPTN